MAWSPQGRISARRCGLPSSWKPFASNTRLPFKSEPRACLRPERSKKQSKNSRSMAYAAGRARHRLLIKPVSLKFAGPFQPGVSERPPKVTVVDFIDKTHQQHVGDFVSSPPFSLPLVSVIIVNYNYGRFLKQAVDSVFEQTYPNIECIIVDNASTDESTDVLAVISKQYPGVTILRRGVNGGQSLATKEGFEASSGEYIVFLDADDVFLPSCIATHIFVHLSLRIPVGFTSADMIQSVDSRMVLGTIYGFSEYVLSGRGVKSGLLRRIDKSAPDVWSLCSPDAELESQIHFVPPCDIGTWRWAPTSGNCFRRDALQLFLNNENLGALRSCTDSFLIRGI